MKPGVFVLVLFALLSMLSACAPKPTPPQAHAEPPAPKRDIIAEVRAAAAGDDALAVQPLRDLNAEDWRLQAEQRVSAGDLTGAAAALAEALKAAPEDPELLQLAAEIALARGEYLIAERDAYRAFELGPRVGPLCRRHWAAIRLARELSGNPNAAATAAAQTPHCTHRPPVRM